MAHCLINLPFFLTISLDLTKSSEVRKAGDWFISISIQNSSVEWFFFYVFTDFLHRICLNLSTWKYNDYIVIHNEYEQEKKLKMNAQSAWINKAAMRKLFFTLEQKKRYWFCIASQTTSIFLFARPSFICLEFSGRKERIFWFTFRYSQTVRLVVCRPFCAAHIMVKYFKSTFLRVDTIFY